MRCFKHGTQNNSWALRLLFGAHVCAGESHACSPSFQLFSSMALSSHKFMSMASVCCLALDRRIAQKGCVTELVSDYC